MRGLQGVKCLQNIEMKKLGVEVFKKTWGGGFSFSQTPLRFRIVFEMTLGVRNYFANPLGFRTTCEIVLGL